MIARRIMLTERYPDGWEGFVPGLELQTGFLPAGHPVRAALVAETRRMLDQALTLVNLADPAETAAEQEVSS